MIADGETGLLVPPGDVPALAGALNMLVANASWRQCLAERGQQHVRAHFSVDSMIDEHDVLYQSLAQHRDRALVAAH